MVVPRRVTALPSNDGALVLFRLTVREDGRFLWLPVTREGVPVVVGGNR